MKKYLLLLPEFVVLALSIYWFLENLLGNNHINYIALVVCLIVISQIIFKNKFTGIFIATIVAAFSLFMILAVLSEFYKFPVVNSEAVKLLLIGMLLCFSGLLSSGVMFYKYSVNPSKTTF
jgi:hypothetical protein